MSRLLVATALEETWGHGDPLLFLGEWCRRHSRRERWASQDAVVLPYHWESSEKFERDYWYLSSLHDRLLAALANALNGIHGVCHDLRYWRILVGPWLGLFTQILFDRWSVVHDAIRSHDICGTILPQEKPCAWVPNDMQHFVRLMTGDAWNQHIFSSILRNDTKVPITETGPADAGQIGPAQGQQNSLRGKLKQIYSSIAGVFARDSDGFLMSTALPLSEELALQVRLGQIPRRWSPVTAPRVAADPEKRLWKLPLEAQTEFEKFISTVIPQELPTAYLEGYARLVECVSNLAWPKAPKFIFSSNALFHDTVTMAYAAGQTGRGCRLIYGQHGGNYWMLKLHWGEAHEVEIADSFLSWGFTDKSRPKIAPICFLLPRRLKRQPQSRRDRLLVVMQALPRYSYSLFSGPKSTQLIRCYLEDLFAFTALVAPQQQAHVTIRLPRSDYGWDFAGRWRERYPAIDVDSGRVPIENLLAISRIIVCTYCSTTFFEAIANDLPVIAFWDPKIDPPSEAAAQDFQDLRGAGIFHDNPESAARQVNAIWDSVDVWWQSNAVRSVLASFSDRYCRDPARRLTILTQAITQVAAQDTGLRTNS